MKLLLVHRYIRPDTPGYAHMLYIMARRFTKDGHQVTIFSAQPGYNDAYDGPPVPRKENVDGLTIIRIPMLKESKKKPTSRAINFLIFGIWLLLHSVVRIKAYDLMTVSTFPPTIMGAVARTICFWRKTQYIYHCMDLYPEIAQASSAVKKSRILSLAARIDKRNCDKAKAVVVLSDDMLKTLQQRGISGDHIHVINNFIIDSVANDDSLPPILVNSKPDRFRVLFAGNIGRFQSLDTIVDAAKILHWNDQIEFWFIGAGTNVESLKKQAGSLLDKSVFFHPYMPIQKVLRVIHQSNLGVVSLEPNVIKSAYPSKTMTYLEAGCKLLCLVEDDSSLASFVQTNLVGFVCHQPASPKGVSEVIETAYEKWKDTGSDRKRIQAVGRNHFGQNIILEHWSRLIVEDRHVSERVASTDKPAIYSSPVT